MINNTNEQKEYTFEEACDSSREYFKGDNLAATVWVSKYAVKNSYGAIFELNPSQMHNRIANELARIESNYPNSMSKEHILSLLEGFKYVIPQGGPMTGIGNSLQIASLSNCFVIGHKSPADSYGGIIRIDEEQVQLMKRRGGVGHDLSHIRPKGSPVLNSALTSTGVVPFMERYSNSTREVAQDGRRGALMLSLSIKHPDSEKFIDAKMEDGKVTGANISVKIDDDFMRAAIDKKSYNQRFPINSSTPQYTQNIDAAALWNKIVHNAWKSAEPGILFWDTIIRESVPDCYSEHGFTTVSTNPCGEIPLCPHDSCRLLALNLYSYVNKPFTAEASFDFELFKQHANSAMRLMDDIIDLEIEKIEAILNKVSKDPEESDIRRVEAELWTKIKEKALMGRRTGLGITAEGDMLAAMGITYGTEEAIEFSTLVQKTLALAAYGASVEMAEERGAFPIYNAVNEENNPFINRIKEADSALYERMIVSGRRNIALLTIAPTGTTSLMSQTTSGIEPVFKPYYKRRRKVNPNDKSVNISYTDESGDSFEEYFVFHHKFITWAEIQGYKEADILHMSNSEIEELVEKSPYHKATANDINWVNKVKLQGAVQKWVDHSISVTVNLPNEVTEELVAEVYQTAWECGCKGVTVYRDGSRDGVLISADDKKQGSADRSLLKRPAKINADVVRFKNGAEDWIAFVGIVNDSPYEIFTGKVEEDALYIPKYVKQGYIVKVREEDGTKRYDFQYEDKYGYLNSIGGVSRLFDETFWNYAKLISGVLRNGMPIVQVTNLVSSLSFNIETINTWKNGVARTLAKYIPTGTKIQKKCSKCGEAALVYQEGCLVCTSCGDSKCG